MDLIFQGLCLQPDAFGLHRDLDEQLAEGLDFVLGSGEVQLELHYIEVDWLCLTISGDWGLISLHPNTPNCGRSWYSLLGLGDESGLFVIVVEVCPFKGMFFILFYLLSCNLSLLLLLQFE